MDLNQNNDKTRYTLAIFLSLFILLTWTFFFNEPVPNQTPSDIPNTTSSSNQSPNISKKLDQEKAQNNSSPSPVISPVKSDPLSSSKKTVKKDTDTDDSEKNITLKSDVLEITLSSRNATVNSAILKVGENHYSKNLEADTHRQLQTGRIVFSHPNQNNNFSDDYFNVIKQEKDSVTFSKQFIFGENQLTLLKKYTIKNYKVNLEILFQGLKDQQKIKYYIINGSILNPFSPNKSFFDITQLSFEIGSDIETALSQGFLDVFSDPILFMESQQPVDWISIDDRFYARIMQINAASKPNQTSIFFLKEKVPNDWISSKKLTPETISSLNYQIGGYTMETKAQDQFTFFYLPKKRDLLNQYYDDQKEYFFNLFHQFKFMQVLSSMMYWVLERIHQLIGSYGWSIIIMTLLLKLAIFPLTQRSMKSMQKMQLLSPKIETIKKSYKKHPQKMNSEMMALYKKEGVNPLGGCIPMLIPLPIFIALYSLFQNMVELQGKSFLWIHDLSLPDIIFTLNSSLPFIGSEIHLLPFIMVVSAFGQSMVTPQSTATTSKEARQQMMMMKYFMPFFFFFISWSMPSALILYWTMQNLFSIGQSLIVKATVKKETQLKK